MIGYGLGKVMNDELTIWNGSLVLTKIWAWVQKELTAWHGMVDYGRGWLVIHDTPVIELCLR